MGLEQARVHEIVDKAKSHRWSVPEFQRGFVWTPQKVRDLIDSLWRDYPIGSFLIWYGDSYEEPRSVSDGRSPDAWLVDGQQRTTAFCVLFGTRPYWWGEDWDDLLKRYDVRFNALSTEEPYFSLYSAAMRGPAGRAWIRVQDLLNADDDGLSGIIEALLRDLGLPGARFGLLWTRLDKVRKVRDAVLPVVTVMLDLEDVTEIFARLNSAGTKVTEADIALALAASQNPGWARQEFLPFLKDLEDAGFDLDPNLVFRSCVGIGLGKARLKEVPRAYWTSSGLMEAWKRTAQAWRRVIQYVEARGILSADVLPTKTALIPVAILADRYPNTLASDVPFAWILHATRTGRYSGSALTALDQDLQAIEGAGSAQVALDALRAKLPEWERFAPEDFSQDYRDRFLRLILYLTMHSRGARDWVSGEYLGFHGTELLERFNPDWHHIFPRAYLRQHGIPEDRWDLFANIAVMSPSTNIRFGARNPMGYLERYGVDDVLLEEQLVADRQLLTVEKYEEFLALRAQALATAANRYFESLVSGTRHDPPRPSQPRLSARQEKRRVKPRPVVSDEEFLTNRGAKLGDQELGNCRAVLEAVQNSNVPGVTRSALRNGCPAVYLTGTRVGKLELVQLSPSQPTFRDGVKVRNRWKADQHVLEQLAKFRRALSDIPGSRVMRTGRVYVPTDSLAAHLTTFFDATRHLATALARS